MSEVKNFLKNTGFRFKKAYGQNFITDSNLLESIVSDAQITSQDTVLEIGAGAGTLTKVLAKVAKNVIAFEIDENLIPVLGENLKGLDNKVEVVFKDIMKTTNEELKQISGIDYKVVANLPYYITTPIVTKLLELENKPKSIGVMVQKEVGDRMVAKPGTSDYGVLTLAIMLEGKARITRNVSRKIFYPSPNVDSCFVQIEVTQDYKDIDKAKVKALIKRAFAMRRKTLINNLLPFYNKTREELQKILESESLCDKVRGETLSLDQFISLSNRL